MPSGCPIQIILSPILRLFVSNSNTGNSSSDVKLTIAKSVVSLLYSTVKSKRDNISHQVS